MATVKQVLAAISQDGTLGPNQKRFVIEAIDRASIWIGMTQNKPKKITNAKNLKTLEEWEEDDGWINQSTSMGEWIDRGKLCPNMINMMLVEFREMMRANGKQYANFAMAFRVYLRKGYLSKSMESCTLERSTFKQSTVVHTKGIEL